MDSNFAYSVRYRRRAQDRPSRSSRSAQDAAVPLPRPDALILVFLSSLGLWAAMWALSWAALR
jgi:hypothetical protein